MSARGGRPTMDVSDLGGAIFANGAASFVTVRRARPEWVAGAFVRVRETGRRFAGPVDRGEWVVERAEPETGPSGPTGRVRLTMRRLAEIYVRAPRG